MRDPVDEPSPAVIDLDAADDRPARSGGGSWHRLRRVASSKVSVRAALTFVLLAALVGAAIGQRWEAGRQRDRQAGEVSLFVAVGGFESAAGDGRRVVIEGSVAVVNGGPRPVQVAGAGRVADLMVWGERRIGPAETGRFRTSVTVACADGAGDMPLPVELSVVTADGVRRAMTAQLQLVGSRWQYQVVIACAPQR